MLQACSDSEEEPDMVQAACEDEEDTRSEELRGLRPTVGQQPSKLRMWVRFPQPVPCRTKTSARGGIVVTVV